MKAPLFLFVGTKSSDIIAVREALHAFAAVAMSRQIPVWSPLEPAVSPLLCRMAQDHARAEHIPHALKIFVPPGSDTLVPGGIVSNSGYVVPQTMDLAAPCSAAVFIGSGGDLLQWWAQLKIAQQRARRFPVATTGLDCATMLGETSPSAIGTMLRYEHVYSELASQILPT